MIPNRDTDDYTQNVELVEAGRLLHDFIKAWYSDANVWTCGTSALDIGLEMMRSNPMSKNKHLSVVHFKAIAKNFPTTFNPNKDFGWHDLEPGTVPSVKLLLATAAILGPNKNAGHVLPVIIQNFLTKSYLWWMINPLALRPPAWRGFDIEQVSDRVKYVLKDYQNKFVSDKLRWNAINFESFVMGRSPVLTIVGKMGTSIAGRTYMFQGELDPQGDEKEEQVKIVRQGLRPESPEKRAFDFFFQPDVASRVSTPAFSESSDEEEIMEGSEAGDMMEEARRPREIVHQSLDVEQPAPELGTSQVPPQGVPRGRVPEWLRESMEFERAQDPDDDMWRERLVIEHQQMQIARARQARAAGEFPDPSIDRPWSLGEVMPEAFDRPQRPRDEQEVIGRNQATGEIFGFEVLHCSPESVTVVHQDASWTRTTARIQGQVVFAAMPGKWVPILALPLCPNLAMHHIQFRGGVYEWDGSPVTPPI